MSDVTTYLTRVSNCWWKRVGKQFQFAARASFTNCINDRTGNVMWLDNPVRRQVRTPVVAEMRARRDEQ